MFFDRPKAGRRAVLLQVDFRRLEASGEVGECALLAKSAEIDIAGHVSVVRDTPHPRWYVGTGKLVELQGALTAARADLLVVNGDPSPGQQRNLEQTLDCRVVSRTELILLIFADRAQTHEGHLQVELAQLKHAQTRLVRGWTHLDRQKGGIGMRGVGETQIELDQRMLSSRIKSVQKKLADVRRRRGRNRRRRHRSGVRTIALVGYTNAGKSTLFNALTAAGVNAEDKLFATLDPTMRKLEMPGMGELVLADTVGFISHLPHSLVEAFKATLEEVVNADLLVHVVDATDPLIDDRITQVQEVLAEIGAAELPCLVVFNKLDALESPRAFFDAPQACNTLLPTRAVAVSAVTGEGIPELLAAIDERLGAHPSTEVVLPASDGKTRAWLYRRGAVIAERLRDDGRVALTVQADTEILGRLRRLPRIVLRPESDLPNISPLPN